MAADVLWCAGITELLLKQCKQETGSDQGGLASSRLGPSQSGERGVASVRSPASGTGAARQLGSVPVISSHAHHGAHS